MKAIDLVAHGSRRAASNDEIRQLAGRLAPTSGAAADFVTCGFLELAEPSIPDSIQACIDAGAIEVVVLPYFLSAGRHVVEDIPAEVAKKQAEYPELKITIAPYLGSAPALTDILLGVADAAAGATSEA